MRIGSTVLAVGLLLTAGCAMRADTGLAVTLEKSFQLRVGEAAIASDAGLEIGVLAVSADSRCGKGEVCIWEGDAVVRIWMQRAGEAREERELHTASTRPTAIAYAGYTVRLVALFPPAISGRSIAATDYVATFELSRGDAASDASYE